MTHSDLSSRDCGISSGISRISEITMPEFSTRSTSFCVSGGRSGRDNQQAQRQAIPRAFSYLCSFSRLVCELELGLIAIGWAMS